METSSGGDSMFEKLNAGRRGGARQVLSSGAVVLAAHVVIGAVAATLGRVEPRSVSIVASPDPGFAVSARDYVLRALFRPARVHGRPVRVLVRLPIDFALTTVQ